MTPINNNVIAFPVKKNKPPMLDTNDIENLATLFVSALHQVNEISFNDKIGQNEVSQNSTTD